VKPTITAAISAGTLGDNGWYTGPVTVHFTCADGGSGVASCPADQVLSAQGMNTSTAGTATDAAGNVSDPSNTITVKIDGVKPTISAAISAGTLGNNGWYTSPVTVHFTCNDAGGSGVANCPPDQVLSAQGTNTSTAGTATDAAGNESNPSNTITVKIDAVKPVITFSGNAGAYTVDQRVSITCAATDAMSGIATSTCPGASGDAYTFANGANTLNASATDNAGNLHTASTTFTVSVTNESLCALVKRFVTNAGVANSFCVKLPPKAYDAFRNELRAQGGKKFLSEAHAAILLRLVNLLG